MQELCQLEGHDGCVWHGAWAPTGTALATCGEDQDMEGPVDGPWCLSATLEETQTGTIRSSEFSPCGRFLASASFDATVAIWELQDGEWECVANLEGHDNEVKSVAWSPSGALLATCSRDKSVWIWTTNQGVDIDDGGGRDPEGDGDDDQWECLAVLNGHAQDVKFIQWHPHEKLLFSASYDDTIRVWSDDLDDWLCVATLAGHKSTVWGLAFDKSGERFASCSQDGSVKVWERRGDAGTKWVEIASLNDIHDKQPVYSVHWSEDGVIVTGGGDNRVCLIEEEEKPAADDGDNEKDGNVQDAVVFRVVDSFEAHSGDVNCVRWHPKKKGMLVTTSDEGQVKLWTTTKSSGDQSR